MRSKKQKEQCFLLQGCESTLRISLLLELTSIKSESGISAIMSHFVDGLTVKNSEELHGHTHLSRDIKVLNKVAGIVEKIKDNDWHKFKKEN
jgi:hypothetical protein